MRRASFVEIVEQIDCTPEQREIREVFPSYYCVKVDELLFALSRLKNENKKNEYYLTDIYGILRNAGQEGRGGAGGDAPKTCWRSTAASSRRRSMRSCRTAFSASLREAGVTIVSGINTYIEAGVTIGPDTIDSAVHVHRPRFEHRRRLRDRPVRDDSARKHRAGRDRRSRETSSAETASWSISQRKLRMSHVAHRRRQTQALHRPGQPAAGAEDLRLSADSAGPRPHRVVPRRRIDRQGGGRRPRPRLLHRSADQSSGERPPDGADDLDRLPASAPAPSA